MNASPDAVPAGVDIAALVRQYEPVIRYTDGELFFPTDVTDYIEQAALWVHRPGSSAPELLVDHGDLDVSGLCTASLVAEPGAGFQLRYVAGPLTRTEMRSWRRDPDRPRFHGSSRFAAVGLLGRLIDALFRLSLIIRGSVPGGLTAAAHRKYRDSAADRSFPYYAHVSAAGGYLAIQYWFFYVMNDWRSTFGGVNDHGADWEQVTIYLAPTDPDPAEVGVAVADGADQTPGLRVAWLAFSAHDETGDDLRRRPDDPDITWVAGTHPVVNAGPGSHSGSYLAGEYLVSVQPPVLRRTFSAIQRVFAVLVPWTERGPTAGAGLPYIDYKRGDGMQIGPGTGQDWSMVLIDAQTPWVRDFRGLWGLDTGDPFGGERAPAGPRYERNGTIRPSWSDPIAWAGLEKVPATRSQREQAIALRLDELEQRRRVLTAEIDERVATVRQLSAGLTSLGDSLGVRDGLGGRLAEQQRALPALRSERSAAITERELLSAASSHPQTPGPHAHLRIRAVPDVIPPRPPGVLLRIWTQLSLSVLLLILGLSLIVDHSGIWTAFLAASFAVSAIEAVLRRRLVMFLAWVLLAAVVVGIVILLFHNLRAGLGLLSIVAAAVVLVANVRSYLAHR